jgi:hypothetical protein
MQEAVVLMIINQLEHMLRHLTQEEKRMKADHPSLPFNRIMFIVGLYLGALLPYERHDPSRARQLGARKHI